MNLGLRIHQLQMTIHTLIHYLNSTMGVGVTRSTYRRKRLSAAVLSNASIIFFLKIPQLKHSQLNVRLRLDGGRNSKGLLKETSFSCAVLCTTLMRSRLPLLVFFPAVYNRR
ncbi:hypothetical protein Tcan_00127 [Toxocara canis]|uniref:Uncharacterized protein n=1 Tax=Toxocara canis TaxID=6265 RepID=A0A0B2VLS2_TOXCA|nr:hypothetical protein Tcan_00127 [Toxocara canis]